MAKMIERLSSPDKEIDPLKLAQGRLNIITLETPKHTKNYIEIFEIESYEYDWLTPNRFFKSWRSLITSLTHSKIIDTNDKLRVNEIVRPRPGGRVITDIHFKDSRTLIDIRSHLLPIDDEDLNYLKEFCKELSNEKEKA